jgi:hypothetical protein
MVGLLDRILITRQLRDRAARLLALALKAREDDKILLPEEITKVAIEASPSP